MLDQTGSCKAKERIERVKKGERESERERKRERGEQEGSREKERRRNIASTQP